MCEDKDIVVTANAGRREVTERASLIKMLLFKASKINLLLIRFLFVRFKFELKFKFLVIFSLCFNILPGESSYNWNQADYKFRF